MPGSIVGIIVLGIGILIAARAKGSYTVRIASASGEKDALELHNKARIQRIVNAINESIVERG